LVSDHLILFLESLDARQHKMWCLNATAVFLWDSEFPYEEGAIVLAPGIWHHRAGGQCWHAHLLCAVMKQGWCECGVMWEGRQASDLTPLSKVSFSDFKYC
jgi:hypothetical protein